MNEMDQIRSDIAQELQMKDMLVSSIKELQITVKDLEKKVSSIDEESYEWRTRYESQVEANQQLKCQIELLRKRILEAKQNMKENRFPNKTPEPGEQEITPHYIRKLMKEHDVLSNQLRDFEWRLDQESKAFHKANEEKKQYGLEINASKNKGKKISLNKSPRISQDLKSSRKLAPINSRK